MGGVWGVRWGYAEVPVEPHADEYAPRVVTVRQGAEGAATAVVGIG